MKALFRISVALALAACMAGCVTPGASMVPSAVVTPLRPKVIPADRVKDSVFIGKSTRADVIAALGETLVISFDSGFEVWVYRLGKDTTAEFVILFAPTGLVAKTRIRPAPQPKDEG
jgi:hypothetical protein